MRISGETMEKDAVRIAEGIYWVGYADKHRGLHCNPYLIVEGEEAVLIDGGNRDDFSTVMLKILRTGVEPAQITRLIYQHYDPDLCGSLPQFESIINTKELRIISIAKTMCSSIITQPEHRNWITVIWVVIMTSPQVDALSSMEFPIVTSRGVSLPMIRRQRRCFPVICSDPLIVAGN